MAWLVVLLIVGLLLYAYFKGVLRVISLGSRQKHEIILNMWLDSLDDMEKKAVYGEDTTRIVRMLRHGMEQMAFDLCGYEAMLKMDERQSRSGLKVDVRIGKKQTDEGIEQVRAINEKRIAEVFHETN